MYQHLIFENSDGVVTITLDRPEVMHALNPLLITEITAAIGEAAADDSVRVVVLTGSGDKAFCSGADLREASASAEGAGEMLEKYYEPMILAIRELPKPVVCRLNGLAAGAGCSLALACDVVVASENAYLALSFVQIGLMPDAGLTFMLPRLVGTARSFEFASTGRPIYATYAAEMGLIARVTEYEYLDRQVQELVQYYRHAPTKAIAAMKQAFNQSGHSDLSQMLKIERAGQEMLFGTADLQEGISSFLQKKKPDFQGR